MNSNAPRLHPMTPREFQQTFAPNLSVAACRDLFHAKGFPMIQIGNRLFTSEEAAGRWLSCMGDYLLLSGGEEQQK
jgi:hypothetical protein